MNLSENPLDNAISEKGGAESGALNPELVEIISMWGTLPAAVRAGILAMIRAATG